MQVSDRANLQHPDF